MWGQGVFARANQILWPAPGSRRIAKAETDLYCAVSRYSRILEREDDPGRQGSRDAFAEALCQAAADVQADAGYLIDVIGTHCGAAAAAYVNGLPA
ncbi:MAG: hypothetical protein ACRDOB_05680 [Streptosporangiaceae bacterium]